MEDLKEDNQNETENIVETLLEKYISLTKDDDKEDKSAMTDN